MTERRILAGKHFARWAGFALVIGAMLASGVRLADREPAPEVMTVHPRVLPDPLATELVRCKAITDPNAVDERCKAAWAESRRRFLSPDPQDETSVVRVVPLLSKNQEQLAPGASGQPSIHDQTSR